MLQGWWLLGVLTLARDGTAFLEKGIFSQYETNAECIGKDRLYESVSVHFTRRHFSVTEIPDVL